MARTYKVKNLKTDNKDKIRNKEYEVASKQYVDYVAKQICDIILEHINTANTHDGVHNINKINLDKTSETTKLLIDENTSGNKIKAEDIETNANYRFISETMLHSLKNKPTIAQLNRLIEDSKVDIKNYLALRFDELLNLPLSMEKIKTLSNILKDEPTIDSIMEEFALRTRKEDFDSHVSSNLHVTNNDRKALNVLVDVANNAFADWNAGVDDTNYIKNKPTSLPANGGNADTISGFDVSYLLNKSTHDFIIGYSGANYHPESTNICLNSDLSNKNDVVKYIESITNGSIFIRAGLYKLDELSLFKDRSSKSLDVIITGCGSNSIISKTNITINHNIKLRDLKFKDVNLHIGGNCEIQNCQFANSTIYLEGSSCSMIKNCRMNDSTVIYIAECTNNIITENYMINVNILPYLGNGNIILNNIII